MGLVTGAGKTGTKAVVALVRTRDRSTGVKRAIDLAGVTPVAGKGVLLKPNFNSADPFPASTHNDTLTHLIRCLQSMGAKSITVGERSGPRDTGDVLEEKGIPALCRGLGVGLVNFDDLPASGWVRVRPGKSHWLNGFDVARPLLDAECVVTTCCLKTHGFGGVFTMSLKLSVGVTSKRNMAELHVSLRSMRRMVAEINLAYQPSLVLLDGIDAFVDGGPAHGTPKSPGVLLAGADRVAIDAVGLAVLKEQGSNRDIMGRRIFEQEQIEIVADDEAGREYAGKLMQILSRG